MNIVVLCGGLSNERDVSISTGTGAARALRERGHQVVLIDLYLGYAGSNADPEEIFNADSAIADCAVAEDAPDLESLDLSLLSEVKRNEKGTVEIRLIDRLRALEQLSLVAKENNTDLETFLQALQGEDA